MKTLLAVTASALFAFSALAADTACTSQANGKPTAGHAKDRSISNCGMAECAALAAQHKLAGLAKSRFLENCRADAQRDDAGDPALNHGPVEAAHDRLAAKCLSIEECGDLSTELEATAAGLGGEAGANSGHTFVRIKRISE
jgi:hypothetical protein